MDSTSETFGIMRDVLLELTEDEMDMGTLIEKMTAECTLKPSKVEVLTRLAKRFGFIEELSEKKLKVTIAGSEFVKHINSIKEKEPEVTVDDIQIVDESSVSITIPHFYLPLPLEIKNKILFTRDTMKQVVEDAQKKMYIVTPLLDISQFQNLFVNILKKPNVEIKIITSEEALKKYQNSPKGNFTLEEIGKLLKSRYKSGKIYFVGKDMSIAHAKIFCSERTLFVTSANVKKNSISENFELGLYTERIDLINTVREIIEFIIDSNYTECIYDSER